MKRILFVVPPLAGHVNPTISVARDLASRGHSVAWVAHPRRVRPLLPEGAELIPLDDGVSDDVWNPILARARSVRGLESFQFLWQEVLIPLARGMFPGVLRAIEDLAPDLVVVDHQALGGALAARRAGVKWASFCTTSASVTDPLADLPKIKAWVLAQLSALEKEVGLDIVPQADLSPLLVIVFSSEALVGSALPFPAHYRFVGPSLSDRPETTPFPWEALREDVPRLFVSLGTVSSENSSSEAFCSTVAAAFADQPVQVVVAAPENALLRPPANFIVRARVPQLALLPRVQAVICHAGHNTVCESLSQGLPLIVTPIRDDQPVIANQVVRAGAGIRLKFGRLTAPALRAATFRLLTEPSFRAAAEALRASFVVAGGAPAAARMLEALL